MSMVGGVGAEVAARGRAQDVPPTALQAAIRAAQAPDAVNGPAGAADPVAGAERGLDLTV